MRLASLFAVALLAWLPGHALLPLLVPKTCEAPRHRLLLEVLLGNVLLSLFGFALAEAGSFSVRAVAALAAACALAGNLAQRVRPLAHLRYSQADLGTAALALAALCWISPPFDTSLFGYDSSAYLAAGIHIAERGELAIRDPTVLELPMPLRQQLFPPYDPWQSGPPFLRVAGGLLLPSLSSDRVLPAFHHLLSVWVALFYGIGGDPAAPAAVSYFGALSVPAICAVAAQLGGSPAALFCAALMLGLVPQYWYSRFLMPEVPSQYFLWAGLLAGSLSLASRDSRLGTLAGAAAAVAGFLRLDLLAHFAVALAAWSLVAPRHPWPGSRGFAVTFLAVTAYGILHHFLFPTHYLYELRRFLDLARTLAFSRREHFGWAGGLGIAALALLLAFAWGCERRGAIRAAGVRVAAATVLLVFAAAVFFPVRSQLPVTAPWLLKYWNWGVLVAAGLGASIWIRRAQDAAQRIGLVTGIVALTSLVHDPHVSQAALWGIRRFLPAASPLLAISAALAAAWLWSRAPRGVAISLAALAAAGWLPRGILEYREPAYRGSIHHVRAIAALLPPASVLAGDSAIMTRTQLHVALQAIAGISPFLLASPSRPELIALQKALQGRRLFWLGPPELPVPKPEGLEMQPVAAYRFWVRVREPEDWANRPAAANRATELQIYEIHAQPAKSESQKNKGQNRSSTP